jgi:ADP-ribosylglycohydrolase
MNNIISIQDTTTSITEVITVQRVKDYIRLEGFTEAGGSEVAFTDDDTLIALIIKSVREKFEKISGLF